MTQLCIVVDTNVWVSGTAYPNSIPGKIVAACRNGNIDFVLSHYILDEIQRVLPRLNHRLNWTAQDIQDYVDSLAFLANLVEPENTDDIDLRDTKDRPVLGTFLVCKANYLVTGDGDLLELADKYSIVSPAKFWSAHGC